jgi:hypothetical protein
MTLKNFYPLSQACAQIKSQQIVFHGETVHGGIGVSSAEQVWDVPSDQVSAWITACLGFAKKGGGQNQIIRQLPAQHPRFGWLWCAGCDAEGLAPTGQDTFSPDVATYKRWRTRLHWESPPYNILPDGLPEYNRFLTLTNVSSDSTAIKRNSGSFAFSPNAPTGFSNGAAINESYGVAQIVTRIAYEYIWVQVPDDGLYDGGGFDSGGVEKNILSCIGTVNNVEFFGKPPGTLLFSSYKPIPRTNPIDPTTFGLPNGKVPRTWDVQLRFIYFNPPSGEPQGDSPDSPGPGGALGHNLVPHPNDGKWYCAYLTGKTALNPVNSFQDSRFWRYQTSNFSTIFLMN